MKTACCHFLFEKVVDETMAFEERETRKGV
jgi:hypothetical protein